MLALGFGTVLIRVQAIALLLAVVTAPLLLRRSLRPFALLYGVAVGGGALLVLAQLVARRLALEPARRVQGRRRDGRTTSAR